jgi:hypothetical protein
MSAKKENKPISIRAKGNHTGNSPSYLCPNCGCKRYNTCGCKRGVEKTE